MPTPGRLELGWDSALLQVEKHSRYFHAYTRHWPKEQPNYLGFRYGGRLQQIRHVERRDIRLGLTGAFPGIRSEPAGEEGYSYAVYTLGPPTTSFCCR